MLANKHIDIKTQAHVYMHSHYALQQKFIKYLVPVPWKPSLILSRAVGHNYKDSSSINTETL